MVLLFHRRQNRSLGRLNYCLRPHGEWSSWDQNLDKSNPVCILKVALYLKSSSVLFVFFDHGTSTWNILFYPYNFIKNFNPIFLSSFCSWENYAWVEWCAHVNIIKRTHKIEKIWINPNSSQVSSVSLAKPPSLFMLHFPHL